MQTRKIPRKTITIPGRYFTGRGTPTDVVIADLSVKGCRFAVPEGGLVPGTRVQIFIGKAGPFHGTVKWATNGEVGLTFVTPIPDEQYDSFQNSHVPYLGRGDSGAAFDEVPEALPNRFC